MRRRTVLVVGVATVLGATLILASLAIAQSGQRNFDANRMAGKFEVRDGSGKVVASGEASHAARLDVYAKNITNAFSFFLDERSRFVDELLDRVRSATEEEAS